MMFIYSVGYKDVQGQPHLEGLTSRKVKKRVYKYNRRQNVRKTTKASQSIGRFRRGSSY